MKYYTVSEASKMLGITRTAGYKAVKHMKDLLVQECSGMILIPEHELTRYKFTYRRNAKRTCETTVQKET